VNESVHGKLERVREPRVHITYQVEIEACRNELPPDARRQHAPPSAVRLNRELL
jgi:hypothetical protein